MADEKDDYEKTLFAKNSATVRCAFFFFPSSVFLSTKEKTVEVLAEIRD